METIGKNLATLNPNGSDGVCTAEARSTGRADRPVRGLGFRVSSLST